ncbi:MAG TPA: hypothetical protein DEB31_08195 [Clostridiales bacterium]|nr:hypothetical protein [Clostridiales bacterium]
MRKLLLGVVVDPADKQEVVVMRGEESNKKGRMAPYGYVYDDKEKRDATGRTLRGLVIHKKEAMVVCKMFELCIEYKFGGRRIADYLAAKGYVTRNGHLFNYSTILRMLSNQLYMGIVRRGKAAPYYNSGLAIVSESTFEKAQEAKRKNTSPSNWSYADGASSS